MAKSFSELQTLAIQIRDELNKKKNSAQRVGSALLDIIDNCIQNITDIKQKLSVFEHACSGFKRVSSEAQLPVTPSQEDLAKGFLVNTSLYLYVGTGGNAVNGRYFNVGDIRGPQGEPGSKGETGNTGPTGEKGEQGNSGVTGDTSDIVVINNLDGGESEEGSIKVLAAEQGKVLNKKFTELEDKSNEKIKYIEGISYAYSYNDKDTNLGIKTYNAIFFANVKYKLYVKNIERDTNDGAIDCRIYISLYNGEVEVKRLTDTTSKDNSDIFVDFELTKDEADNIDSIRLYSSRGNTVYNAFIYENTEEIAEKIENNHNGFKSIMATCVENIYSKENINGSLSEVVEIPMQIGIIYEITFIAEDGGVALNTTNSMSSSDIVETISSGLLYGNKIYFTPTKESKYIRISYNSSVLNGALKIRNLSSNSSLENKINDVNQSIINKAAYYTKNIYTSKNYPDSTSYKQDITLEKDTQYKFSVNILNNPQNISIIFEIIYTDNTRIYSSESSESFVFVVTVTKDIKSISLILRGNSATSIDDIVELEYYLIEGTNYIDYINGKLRDELPSIINKTTPGTNQLLLIPKQKICITENVAIKDRMQAALQVSKSFIPCIDYRGQLCFEEFSDNENFNTESPILFAEQITNTGLDYDNKIRSWISLDENNFSNYISETKMTEYVNGNINYFSSIWCHGSNDNNLHIITAEFKHVEKGKFKSIFWSLDGGRTYEPAVNNYRGHFSVNSSDINNASSVEIDVETFTVISASDAQSALKDIYNTYDDSTKLEEAAKEYLSDKIIKSKNQQDALRFLADKLIDKGYYVRLEDDELIVYNKMAGTTSNGISTIKIGGVAKTFASAEDMTLSQAAEKAGIFYPTNINYKNTEDTISYSDLVNVDSILCVNNEWYLFSHYAKSLFANLCLKITDIGNLETSSYRYTAIRNSGDTIYVEPCATFDRISNRVYVGMRSQSMYPIMLYYSDDLCQTFKGYSIPNENLKIKQGNAYIFRVNNPSLIDRNFLNTGYKRPINQEYNYTMLVCCVFNRFVGAVFTSTAQIPKGWDNNIDSLSWSEWKPLNHINDQYSPNFGGFEKNGFYFSDAGIASIGSLCYARRYRGLLVGYQGLNIVGKKWSYTISIAKEIC